MLRYSLTDSAKWIGATLVVVAISACTVLKTGSVTGCSDFVARKWLLQPGSTSEGLADPQFIVHPSAALARAPMMTPDATPIATYDVTDFAEHFDPPDFPPAAVLLNREYLVVVGHQQAAVYDTTGRRVRWIWGAGPTAMHEATGGVLLSGDTFAIVNSGTGVIHWHSTISSYLRIRFAPSLASSLYRARPIGLSADTQLVLMDSWTQRAPADDSVARPPKRIGILDMETGALRIVARPPGRSLRSARDGGSPVVLGPTTYAAVWDTVIVAASNEDGYRLDVFTSGGVHLKQICVRVPARPVARRDRKAYTDREIDAQFPGNPIAAESVRSVGREFATRLAAIEGIHVTPGRSLWVVDAIAPLDTTWSATRFDTVGRITGRLLGKVSSLPVAIGDDVVVLGTQTASGFVSWQLARIRSCGHQCW